MTWQVLVVIGVLASALATLSQKKLTDKQIDPIAFAILVQLFGGLMIAVYAISTGFNVQGILHYWPNLILMTVLWSGFNVLNIMALSKVQASHFMVLFQTRVFWTLLVLVLFMGSPFLPKNLLGVMLIISAIVIATPLKHFQKLSRGDFYVFLAAMFFGLGVANDAYVLKGIASPASYTTITMLVPSILLILVFPQSIKKMTFMKERQTGGLFLLMSFICAVSLVATYEAFKLGNPAIISPLTQVSAIVTVVLSIIFLGERDRPWTKLAAILVSFAGVLLLI